MAFAPDESVRFCELQGNFCLTTFEEQIGHNSLQDWDAPTVVDAPHEGIALIRAVVDSGAESTAELICDPVDETHIAIRHRDTKHPIFPPVARRGVRRMVDKHDASLTVDDPREVGPLSLGEEGDLIATVPAGYGPFHRKSIPVRRDTYGTA